MNTHTVYRHVKPQLRQHITNIATLSGFTTCRQTLIADLCCIFSSNPQLQLGEQADHQPGRLRLKARDLLPFPEGDTNPTRKYLAAANRPLRGDALVNIPLTADSARNRGQIITLDMDHLRSEFLLRSAPYSLTESPKELTICG